MAEKKKWVVRCAGKEMIMTIRIINGFLKTIFVLSMVLITFVACGGNVKATPTHSVLAPTPTLTVPPTQAPQNQIDVISKDEAQSIGGFFIKDGDNFIDIGAQQRDKTLIHSPTTVDGGYINAYDSLIMINSDYSQGYIEYSGQKSLVAFSTNGVPNLLLYPIVSEGYTIGIAQNKNGSRELFYEIDIFKDINLKYSSNSAFYKKYPADLQINGGEIYKEDEEESLTLLQEGFVPLKKGEEVILSWYEGTQYFEEQKVADCQYFVYDGDNGTGVNGDLTKFGYVEYDLSNVSNGLYWIENSGILNISQASPPSVSKNVEVGE